MFALRETKVAVIRSTHISGLLFAIATGSLVVFPARAADYDAVRNAIAPAKPTTDAVRRAIASRQPITTAIRNAIASRPRRTKNKKSSLPSLPERKPTAVVVTIPLTGDEARDRTSHPASEQRSKTAAIRAALKAAPTATEGDAEGTDNNTTVIKVQPDRAPLPSTTSKVEGALLPPPPYAKNVPPDDSPLTPPEPVQPVPKTGPQPVPGRSQAKSRPTSQVQGRPVQALPAWWDQQITNALLHDVNSTALTLEELLVHALNNAPQIRVMADKPLIQEAIACEEKATFDWRTFVESRWNDLNEPVGNTLTTGGAPRFNDHQLQYSFGARRTNELGGQVEVSQAYGWQNTNSTYFVPKNQGTARLTLNYTQPLLRGAGRTYNRSLIVVAEMEASAAHHELTQRLQDHLLEVTKAYWTLHLERARLVQLRRLHERSASVAAELERRQAYDAVASQVARARAETASRQSDLFRAEMAVKVASARLQTLTGMASGRTGRFEELISLDIPASVAIPVSLSTACELALSNRPEISKTLSEIKAAAARLRMAENELLPQLNLVMETYASGLRGDSQMGRAFTDQFTTGSPSYTVGLVYELPWGNRAAKARETRRQIEMRQLENQLRATTDVLMLDARIAVQEVETSYKELAAKHVAMSAAEENLAYLDGRWRSLAGEDRSAALMLEDLLVAQKRLGEAEFEFARTLVTYNLALTNLKKTTGTLLQHEMVSTLRGCQDGLPIIEFEKPFIEARQAANANPRSDSGVMHPQRTAR